MLPESVFQARLCSSPAADDPEPAVRPQSVGPALRPFSQ